MTEGLTEIREKLNKLLPLIELAYDKGVLSYEDAEKIFDELRLTASEIDPDVKECYANVCRYETNIVRKKRAKEQEPEKKESKETEPKFKYQDKVFHTTLFRKGIIIGINENKTYDNVISNQKSEKIEKITYSYDVQLDYNGQIIKQVAEKNIELINEKSETEKTKPEIETEEKPKYNIGQEVRLIKNGSIGKIVSYQFHQSLNKFIYQALFRAGALYLEEDEIETIEPDEPEKPVYENPKKRDEEIRKWKVKRTHEIEAELNQFRGSETFTKYHNFVFTEGIEYLVTACKCWWLLDLIWSYQPELQRYDMQVWTLKVNDDESAVITCENGNKKVIKRQEIEYTDFPLKEIDLWYIKGEPDTLLLPSEY